MTEKGFFAALFDFSFTEFITPKIVKVLYGIAVVLAGIAACGFILAGCQQGAGGGIVAIIVAPIVFLLYVIMARVWLEFIVAVFRIAENTRRMAEPRGE